MTSAKLFHSSWIQHFFHSLSLCLARYKRCDVYVWAITILDLINLYEIHSRHHLSWLFLGSDTFEIISEFLEQYLASIVAAVVVAVAGDDVAVDVDVETYDLVVDNYVGVSLEAANANESPTILPLVAYEQVDLLPTLLELASLDSTLLTFLIAFFLSSSSCFLLKFVEFVIVIKNI